MHAFILDKRYFQASHLETTFAQHSTWCVQSDPHSHNGLHQISWAFLLNMVHGYTTSPLHLHNQIWHNGNFFLDILSFHFHTLIPADFKWPFILHQNQHKLESIKPNIYSCHWVPLYMALTVYTLYTDSMSTYDRIQSCQSQANRIWSVRTPTCKHSSFLTIQSWWFHLSFCEYLGSILMKDIYYPKVRRKL